MDGILIGARLFEVGGREIVGTIVGCDVSTITADIACTARHSAVEVVVVAEDSQICIFTYNCSVITIDITNGDIKGEIVTYCTTIFANYATDALTTTTSRTTRNGS